MNTIKKLGLVTLMGLGLSGCMENTTPRLEKPEAYTIKTDTIQQVFRDHDGFRIYSTNSENEYIEEKFVDDGGGYWGDQYIYPEIPETKQFQGLKKLEGHVRVYKDLQDNEPWIARIIEYESISRGNNPMATCRYVEIHMSKNGKLSPGNDEFGGKYRKNEPMKEMP